MICPLFALEFLVFWIVSSSSRLFLFRVLPCSELCLLVWFLLDSLLFCGLGSLWSLFCALCIFGGWALV